jgi:hypothetical protein
VAKEGGEDREAGTGMIFNASIAVSVEEASLAPLSTSRLTITPGGGNTLKRVRIPTPEDWDQLCVEFHDDDTAGDSVALFLTRDQARQLAHTILAVTDAASTN